MFKVGDKVRCIKDFKGSDLSLIKGYIYTITRLEGFSGFNVAESGPNGWWGKEFFESKPISKEPLTYKRAFELMGKLNV